MWQGLIRGGIYWTDDEPSGSEVDNPQSGLATNTPRRTMTGMLAAEQREQSTS
jgi:hypothetical protein